MKEDNGYECNSDRDKLVHNFSDNNPGTSPRCGVQEFYSNDLGILLDTLTLDHTLQGSVTLVSTKPL